MIAGDVWPKAGIVGGLIACVMFFTTSTIVITTPGITTMVHGMGYMSFNGPFLFSMSCPSAYPFTWLVISAKRLFFRKIEPNRQAVDSQSTACCLA
jgi:hypothetical protein